MLEKAEKIVNLLTNQKKQVATMESCTGGGIANIITCIPGASDVLKFSAVTYSNEYKIKMGVAEEIINKYTVYSIETAMEMAKKISLFADSDYGIGITGQLKRQDSNNVVENNDMVYFVIYSRDDNKYYQFHIQVTKETRTENKEIVISDVLEEFIKVLEESFGLKYKGEK